MKVMKFLSALGISILIILAHRPEVALSQADSISSTSSYIIGSQGFDSVLYFRSPARGLSANDIDGIGPMATQVTSAPVLGLLGHWKFDESSWAGDCTTPDMIDSSGNGRHGSACINGDAPFPVPGKFGNAGRFDGINQYANMGPGFNFTSSFTAALWIALDDYDWCGPTGKSQHIIGTHHLATPTGNGRGWGIYWDCDGLAWELTNSTGSAIESYGYVQPSPFPVNGSWHHVALAYDSTVPSATLYWDGVAVYSESGTANVPSFLFNNGEPLTVNGLPYAPSAGAPGLIDDTRVYNRALSPEEITSIFVGADPIPGSGMDTTGVFRPSNGLLYLKHANTSGFADIAINYGLGGDYPVVGDWDGNGTTTIGVYRSGRFLLRNSNSVGFADINFLFGQIGDQPIAGDWNGDGIDTIGVYRPSTGQFLLRNSNSPGAPDMSFFLGNVGDVGIAGDWDGDGKDTTGVFRPSNGVIFLKNTNETGFADIALNYGLAGDKPVVGDWDGNGTSTIGVYRNGTFYLRNSNTPGFAELEFALGIPGDMPIAGNWDGSIP